MSRPKISGIDNDFRGVVISISYFVDDENGEQFQHGQVIMSSEEEYVKKHISNICLWAIDAMRKKFIDAYGEWDRVTEKIFCISEDKNGTE